MVVGYAHFNGHTSMRHRDNSLSCQRRYGLGAGNRNRSGTGLSKRNVDTQQATRGSIVDVHSKSDAYSFPQGTPLPHKHTKKCGFDRTGSHSLNTYVCECGWHEDSDGYILERERDEMA